MGAGFLSLLIIAILAIWGYKRDNPPKKNNSEVTTKVNSQKTFTETEIRVRNSECARAFADELCRQFSSDGEQFKWLLVNNYRSCEIQVFKNGVQIRRIEVTQTRLKQNREKGLGGYDAGTTGWGFGASGYADLPNNKFVYALQDYIMEEIKKNCPCVTVNGTKIKLAPNAKKGW